MYLVIIALIFVLAAILACRKSYERGLRIGRENREQLLRQLVAANQFATEQLENPDTPLRV